MVQKTIIFLAAPNGEVFCFRLKIKSRCFHLISRTRKAGQRISLQSHLHRSENWIIVSGQSKITVGDDVKQYHQGQHIFVPGQSRHRIENTGDTMLTIIEVQLGEYFGEDDIVRYEDDFNRHL